MSGAIKDLLRKWDSPESYHWISRSIFLRGLGFVYCFAFLSLSNQFTALLGEQGLLPTPLFLERVLDLHSGSKWSAFWDLPSIFWWNYSDKFAQAMAWLGLGLSVLLLFGGGCSLLLGLIWTLYLSFVHIGQDFYSFGWEILLLETTFLAMFWSPFLPGRLYSSPPLKIWVFFYLWLIFRVMLGAGLIKIRGDLCWRDLTCLCYHYETQPIPNPLSWYLHQLPLWFHKLGCLWNHVVELIVPFLFFGPRRARIFAGILTVSFQGILILSGNLSFLNYLTMLICIPAFDDRFWKGFAFKETVKRIPEKPFVSRVSVGLAFVVPLILIVLSVEPLKNLFSKHQRMNSSFDCLHLVNTYGAFGTVGRTRPEVILQGTADSEITPDTEWKEYEFKAKPGDVSRRPPLCALYHFRLDWHIWFAGLSDYREHPWLVHLVRKLLENDPLLLGLLDKNPFPDKAPCYIRAELYEYHFTKKSDRSLDWWTRKRLGVYLPPLSLNDPALEAFLEQYGLRKTE